MIGLCEYLPDEQIVAVGRTLATVMPAGGAVMFNSLSDSHGTDRFFRRIFGLHMIHRPVETLCELMRRAGFEEFQSRGEPLGVYQVVTARRRP